MTLLEISDLFDSRMNSFMQDTLVKDEYEKSVYLTRAQDVYYDSLLINFEDSNEIGQDLNKLMVQTSFNAASSTNLYGGHVIDFVEQVRKILRERFVTGTGSSALYSNRELVVKEERLAEIEESLTNPFRQPLLTTCLRAVNESLIFNKVQLYINQGLTFGTYSVTYAKEPEPIVLETLPDGLEVNGQNTATVNLAFKDSSLHKIIEIAVNLALRDAGIYAQSRQGQETE